MILALAAACASSATPEPAPEPSPVVAHPAEEAVAVEIRSSSDLPAVHAAWSKLGPGGELVVRLRTDVQAASLQLDDPFGTDGPTVRVEGGGHTWTRGTLAVRGHDVVVQDLVVDRGTLVVAARGTGTVERVAVLSDHVPGGGGSHTAGIALQLVALAADAELVVRDSILAAVAPKAEARASVTGRGVTGPTARLEGCVLAGSARLMEGTALFTRGRVFGETAGFELGGDVVSRPARPVDGWLEAARRRDVGDPAWGS